jgi:hypothetical protein
MNTNRRIIVSCGVILFVICLCLSVVALSGALGLVFDLKLPESLLPRSATATTENTSVEPTPTASLDEQMDTIQAQVIALRGLSPNDSVARALLTPEELRQHVVDNFLVDYTEEDARKDSLELAALGLLKPNFDLRDFYIELFSEQIAGFYDNETKEMYVVQADSFKGPERLTYAHEYTHVLQDQNYDIQNGLNYNDDACKTDTERCAAIQALIEGDATLLETQWFTQDATPKDRSEVYAFYQDYASPIYDSAPPFMKEDFLFPYQAGQVFVTDLYDAGGWDAVDKAYTNLPVSTEQILHPEKYPSDRPEALSLPSLDSVLGSSWEEVDRGVMGEWYTYLILARGIDSSFQQDDEKSKEAAAGWGGDAYVMYHQDQGDGIVFIMITAWETTKDANEFNSLMQLYVENRFGNLVVDQDGFSAQPSQGLNSLFRIDGKNTIWVLASDLTLAQQTMQQAVQEY